MDNHAQTYSCPTGANKRSMDEEIHAALPSPPLDPREIIDLTESPPLTTQVLEAPDYQEGRPRSETVSSKGSLIEFEGITREEITEEMTPAGRVVKSEKAKESSYSEYRAGSSRYVSSERMMEVLPSGAISTTQMEKTISRMKGVTLEENETSSSTVHQELHGNPTIQQASMKGTYWSKK